jgi:PH (Pleckstrin Homology) domain-containing protein
VSPQRPGRRVFRQRRARVVVYPLAALLFVSLTVIALALPTDGPHPWGAGSRIAMVLFALAAVYFLHRLASVRVVTDDAGVTVVNVVRSRRLEWAEIVGVRLSRDDPWLLLDLSDGDALPAMGVARSEGEQAQQQAREFARLVNEHSRTARND